MTDSRPIDDVYEMRIAKVTKSSKQYKNEEPKVSMTITAEILDVPGNPKFEGAPWKVWIFGLYEGNLTYNKQGKPETTNFGKVLMSMGYSRKDIDGKTTEQIDEQALVGCYLRGSVFTKEGTEFFNTKPTLLLPIRNKEHIKFNTDRKPAVFSGEGVPA